MIKNFAAIVLAGGKGTRLAGGLPSPKPKVLSEIAGRPLIAYTLDILKELSLEEIIIVVGHKASEVKKVVGQSYISTEKQASRCNRDDYKFAIQKERLGTGHAAATGLAEVSSDIRDVLVINGDDSAFYKPETIQKILNKHVGKGSTITFVTLELENPAGLGRVIRDGEKVIGIVEEKIASKEEKKIKEINDGVYCFRRTWLEENLPKIKKSPVGEYYLVDLIGLATSQGEKVGVFKLEDPLEWRGVNTPEELKLADSLMRERLAHASQR